MNTIALPAKPYLPIPGFLLPKGSAYFFTIRPLLIVFRTRFGTLVEFKTESSAAALARLREAGEREDEVVEFSQGGAVLDASSMAALNCYLRATITMGRMKPPFDRLPSRLSGGVDTRYKWSSFCEYLGLRFE